MNAFRKPIEQLETRQLLTTMRGTDIANISDSAGNKDNGQIVTVRFDKELRSGADISKMRMFGYANNTIEGGQTKKTINILSASTSGNILTLRTDVMVRKGAQLNIDSGAVTATDNSTSNSSIRLGKGLNRDRFTLALRAFKVSDKSYFSSSVISGGRTAIVADSPESESTVRSQLNAFLDRKIKEKTINADKKASALAMYDSSSAKAIVSAHNLRAAIVSLVGTVAESAIDSYLGTSNTTGKVPIFIGFGSDLGGGRDAELTYTGSNRLKLTLTDDYAGESFAVLSGRVAHEIMHDSGKVGADTSQDEEVVANFVESVVYAQQIVTDFTYATKGTTYTLYSNYHLYLLLNSGDRQFPRIGVETASLKGGGVANPGFTTGVASFDAQIRAELAGRISDKPPLPMTSVHAGILNKITGNSYTAQNTTYGDSLIASIDVSQDTMSDSFAMRAARVLQVSI